MPLTHSLLLSNIDLPLLLVILLVMMVPIGAYLIYHHKD